MYAYANEGAHFDKCTCRKPFSPSKTLLIGTEMFWNDPDGAEAILQVRAASLSDDARLAKHLATRPGYPFVRRPKPPKLNAEKRKS